MTRMDNGALPLLRLEARSSAGIQRTDGAPNHGQLRGDRTRWPGYSPLPSLTLGVTAKRSVA